MRRPLALLAVLAGLVTAAPASAVPLEATPFPAEPAVGVEPNETPATAQPVLSGQRIRGTLLAQEDVGLDLDHYRVSAQAGERLFAAVTTATSPVADVGLRLIGPDGATVLESDADDGEQNPLSATLAGVPLPQTGTYTLRVSRDGPNVIAPYDLVVRVVPGAATAESEPNDVVAQANPLPAGGVLGTYAAGVGGQDLHRLQLQAGDTVALALDLDPERDGVTWNGRLALAGPSGPLDRVDDPGGDATPSEALVLTAAETGTYVVTVDSSSAGSATATYRLVATVVARETPSCRSVVGSPAGIGDGTTEVPIVVTDPAEIRRLAVNLSITHTRLEDLDVALRSPSGVEVALFNDVALGASGTTTHTATYGTLAGATLGVGLAPVSVAPGATTRLQWFEGTEAAGTWRLVLRDDTPGNGTSGSVLPPTLVLCPQDPVPAGNELFAATFNADDGGFTHSGTADEWERGTPATVATSGPNPVAGLSTCGEGSGCFKTDLDGTYGNGTQVLLSPPISLAGRSGRILASWRQWFQLEFARFDFARVSVVEVGGANPTTLWEWDGPTMTNVGVGPGVGLAIPAAAGWARLTGNLSAYAGRTVQLRFALQGDASVNYAGLAIDDVRIVQPTGTLTVAPAGGGTGRVTSSVGGIDCGAACASTALPLDTPVTLTAVPAAGSVFTGFAGPGCSGAATTCTVTLDRSRTVTATFEPAPIPDPGVNPGTGTGTGAPGAATPDAGSGFLPDPGLAGDVDADTVRPALAIRLGRGRLTARRSATVTLTLSERASVAGSLSLRTCTRRPGARRPTCRTTTRSVVLGTRGQGRSTARIPLRGLRPGTYTLRLTALDAAGNRSAVRTLRLTVRRR